MIFHEHFVSVSSHRMQPDVLTRISAHLSVVPCCDRKYQVNGTWKAAMAEDLLSGMTRLDRNSTL